jgi:hypothetical protein
MGPLLAHRAFGGTAKIGRNRGKPAWPDLLSARPGREWHIATFRCAADDPGHADIDQAAPIKLD